jgi:hypothetical protein
MARTNHSAIAQALRLVRRLSSQSTATVNMIAGTGKICLLVDLMLLAESQLDYEMLREPTNQDLTTALPLSLQWQGSQASAFARRS